MLTAQAIVQLHHRLTALWHTGPDTGPDSGTGSGPDTPSTPEATPDTLSDPFLDAVASQHRANFDLWHIEDEARAPGAADAEIASVKRRIDRTNQLRNDLTEQLDRALLEWLAPRALLNPNAPLHSESPGLIIDRLSILALKVFHTRQEAERPDAPPGHAQRNHDRLTILIEQRDDLAACLDSLWQQTLDGQRRFKLYRQLKMYNDPALNPSIYRSSR